ncbi:MAG: hypothetical protein CL758_04005 [Chloroflexi bacterium]|nr:hypothetical protein [Chloroflexota bacterium]
MKCMTWRGNNNFTLDEIDIPKIKPGMCLIKIHTAGICGTDIHITQGLFPSPKNVILGHEFSGTVVEVSPNVDQSLLGKDIAAHTVGGCGKCESCKRWTKAHCEINRRRIGGFSQYVLLYEQALSIIPKNLSLENASLTEPASASLSCVEMLKPPPSNNAAVVIGNGLLGLFTIYFLKQIGIEKIISSEIDISRRNLSKQFGADILVDPIKENLTKVVLDQTNGYGADIVVEAVGNPKVLEGCFQLIRPRGQMLLVGVNPKGSKLPFDLFEMHRNEISVFGAFGQGNSFERALNHLPNMQLNNIIAGRYPLELLPKIIKKSANLEGAKFVIGPND